MKEHTQKDERGAIGEDWAIIESMLPAQWMDKARELGAFTRVRSFPDARALLRVMLIHLAEGCALRETAVRASLAGIADVSDVALFKRLRLCGPWFEWLAQGLREALQPRDMGDAAVPVPALLGQRRVRVVDGSVVREPGPTGSQWRLHYAIGLPDLHCQEVHLGRSDDGETLKRFEVHAGDLFIADRGYAQPPGIAHVCARGGDVMIRMNLVTLPLYGRAADAGREDVLAHARTLAIGEVRSWPVEVRPTKPGRGAASPASIPGRLCALKKSRTASEKARERVRRESQRGGCELRPETLEAADYVFVFTTLPEEVDAAQVLAIYKLRWQIELEFKRLKSLIQLGHLKKHDPQAARSWLQGKLLVALIVARLIAHAERVSPWGYEIAATQQASHALSVA